MPEPVTVAIITAIGVILGGGISAIVGAVSGRDKNKIDVSVRLEELQTKILDRVQNELDEMQREIELLRAQLEASNFEISILRDRVQLLEAENVRLKNENDSLRKGRNLDA